MYRGVGQAINFVSVLSFIETFLKRKRRGIMILCVLWGIFVLSTIIHCLGVYYGMNEAHKELTEYVEGHKIERLLKEKDHFIQVEKGIEDFGKNLSRSSSLFIKVATIRPEGLSIKAIDFTEKEMIIHGEALESESYRLFTGRLKTVARGMTIYEKQEEHKGRLAFTIRAAYEGTKGKGEGKK